MGRLSTLTHLITSITIFFSCIAGSCAFGSPYVYTGDSKIPIEQFQYLEDLDEKTNLSDLKKANWKGEIENIHSYYNGFWVKLSVLNQTDKSDLGVRHWTTFEKKLFAVNSKGIQEYDFLSFNDGSYSFLGVDRIQFDYRINMPVDSITEIYSFFRFKPLHRSLSKRHETFRVEFWDNIQKQAFFRSLRQVFFYAILIYLFLNGISTLIVTRDPNYFWFTALISTLIISAIYLSGYTLGFRGNPHVGQLIFSGILITIIQFFKSFLQPIPVILNRISIWIISSHFLIILYYFYRSFEFPDGEYFTNLESHPIQPLRIGYFLVIIQFLPTILLLFYFVFFSFRSWRKGDQASGYVIFSLTVPVVSLGLIVGIISLVNNGYLGLEMRDLVALPLGGILLVLCPIAINLALEQRIKAFKDNAMTSLQTLNTELDNKVRERTLDLQKANNLITDSIQSASAIQSAILPSIDPSHYGFSELVYIWEPRDIVGGDFYWLQQQEDWTALVVADCTGHGIPGAFMTLISSTILDRIASLHDLSQPDRILDQLDELLSQTFKLSAGDSTNFGLDCGVCCFSKAEGILRFAGAKSNLYQKAGAEVKEMKGDKVSLGYDSKEHPIPFKVIETKLDEHSSFYLFSDGITDQVGGAKNLMYGKKRLLRQIQSSSTVAEAIEGIMADLASYQSHHKRRDDLTLFGFSV